MMLAPGVLKEVQVKNGATLKVAGALIVPLGGANITMIDRLRNGVYVVPRHIVI